MPEEERFNLSERYEEFGQSVIEKAEDAWSEANRLDEQMATLDKIGELSISGVSIEDDAIENLEIERAQAYEDAAILGDLVVRLYPDYVVSRSDVDDSQDGAALAGDSQDQPRLAPAPKPEGKRSPSEQVERINFRGAKSKEKFEDRTREVVEFIADRGGAVEREGVESAGAIIRDGLEWRQNTWNNFSQRLRQTGVLEFEKLSPDSRRTTRIFINRQRIFDLAYVGDLPSELADTIHKLDSQSGSGDGRNPDFLARGPKK